MRDKVEILQKQLKDLMLMFYEDTGMLPQIEASSSLVNLDGMQFVTKINVSLK